MSLPTRVEAKVTHPEICKLQKRIAQSQHSTPASIIKTVHYFELQTTTLFDRLNLDELSAKNWTLIHH